MHIYFLLFFFCSLEDSMWYSWRQVVSSLFNVYPNSKWNCFVAAHAFFAILFCCCPRSLLLASVVSCFYCFHFDRRREKKVLNFFRYFSCFRSKPNISTSSTLCRILLASTKGSRLYSADVCSAPAPTITITTTTMKKRENKNEKKHRYVCLFFGSYDSRIRNHVEAVTSSVLCVYFRDKEKNYAPKYLSLTGWVCGTFKLFVRKLEKIAIRYDLNIVGVV